MKRLCYLIIYTAIVLEWAPASSNALTNDEIKALKECVAWRKAIGPHGTTDKNKIQTADRIIPGKGLLTLERRSPGTKTLTNQEGLYFASCEDEGLLKRQ